MPGLLQLRPEHMAALNRGTQPACAACQAVADHVPEAPARVPELPPGQYELSFVEFRDYAAVAAVEGGNTPPVGPVHWQEITAPRRVAYIFKHLDGVTSLVAALSRPRQYTLRVLRGDEGAQYHVFLSHFPIPRERIEQFCYGQAGLAELQARAIRLDLDDTRVAKRTGPHAGTVVLTDYRRLAAALLNDYSAALDRAHSRTTDPDVAGRILLATITLQTAAQYGRVNGNVWNWLKFEPDAIARRLLDQYRYPRPDWLDGAPYTTAERRLNELQRIGEPEMRRAEYAAQQLYSWIGRPGYVAMRWDSLRAPADQQATIVCEAALVHRAQETEAGRAFAKDAVLALNGWYMHLLHGPLDHEKAFVARGGPGADAWGTVLRVAGIAAVVALGEQTARGTELRQAARRHRGASVDPTHRDPGTDPVDLSKNAASAVDAQVKARDDAHIKATAGARAAHERARDAAGATAHDAEYAGIALAEAERAVQEQTQALKWLVSQSFGATLGIVPTMRKFAWAPEAVGGSAVQGLVHDPGGAAARDAALRGGRARLDVLQTDRMGAQAVRDDRLQVAADEAARERYTRQVYFDSEALQERYAGRPWLTTGVLLAFAGINLALAARALHENDGAENKWKLAGAMADAVYGVEYALKRPFDLLREAEEAAASGRVVVVGEAAGAVAHSPELLAAAGRLAPVQAAGVVGGIISAAVAGYSTVEALARGDRAGASGYGLVTVGSIMMSVGTFDALVQTGAVLGNSLAVAVARSPVLSWGRWTLWGAVVAVIGTGVVMYMSEGPLEAWMRHSTFGASPRGPQDVAGQLASLLTLLATPSLDVSASDARPAAVTDSLPVMGAGLVVTLRLPFVVPNATTLDVTLYVDAVVDELASIRTGGRVRRVYRAPGFDGIGLRVGPLTDAELAGARTAPALVRSAVTRAAPAMRGDVRAVLTQGDGGPPTLTCYVPLRFRVGGLGHEYEVRGTVKVAVAGTTPSTPHGQKPTHAAVDAVAELPAVAISAVQ